MLHLERILNELGRCCGPAEQAHSLPPACYISRDITSAETDLIFRKTWIGVGRYDLVPKPGSFKTLDVAGLSIILLRDRTNTVRAFANACRHRGARLLDGEGRCSTIRCPFHSWVYALDGNLASAPHMQDVAGFDPSAYGLHTYRAEERLGFIFICQNPDGPGIDEVLGDFANLHAPWPLESLVTTRRRELTVDCNWKAFLEVFNEYYHLPYVHPDSIDDVYDWPDPAAPATGAFASQFGATEGTGGLLQDQQDKALPAMPGLSGRAACGVRYSWVFPNMSFAAGTDALWVYEAYPLGAERCHVVQTACFPPETLATPDAELAVEAYHERLDAALAEDIPALENQQRGFACPDATQGRFQPLLEANVAAFADWYAGRMKSNEEKREAP